MYPFDVMFDFMIIISFLFVLGACIGSFLNVLIDRIPQNRSIWKGRSTCDSCHKKLSPIELIPVVSFILQSGKCKKCKAKIPQRIVFVELLTGSLFAGSFFVFQSSFSFIPFFYFLVVLSLCIAIFFIDLEYGIIPNVLTAIFFVISLVFILLFSPHLFLQSLLTSLCAGLFFLALFFITKGRGMGFGDVKYAFVMGLFLGFPRIIAGFYIAFLTGAFVSLILIIYGKKKLKATIPFGPFLVFATLTSYVWGQQIISYVLAKFF